MEVMVTAGATLRAKFQSNRHHQHPAFVGANWWKKTSTRSKTFIVNKSKFEIVLWNTACKRQTRAYTARSNL